jgi:predicted GNAT family N-acyltransferase
MIKTKWVFGRENLSDVMNVRMNVFRNELGHDIIADKEDEFALHVLVSEDGENYASGRIYDLDGKFLIGMICVDRRVRGKQLGSLVVKMLIDRGFELLAKEIYVNARDAAVDFYKKLNFEICSEAYVDVNGENTIPMVLKKENSPIPSGCSGCSGCSDSGGCSGCN